MDGRNGSEIINDEVEYTKVRCTSQSTEQVVSQRRRAKSKFPGLALGASLMKSPAEMKYQIIGNELHNIVIYMKRVRERKLPSKCCRWRCAVRAVQCALCSARV
ncbi:hypothetical protein BV898_10872 [Hypsibius exemplaris]|uniref:Uncharacterized protein n=1 Tax=Hypsibius exemplaris TaxID=2072580 RepID=A0A1W0WID0_HYPEX|nr:hypothetical protein BV898_10872 [Hypsibius exemplaris]